MENNTKPTIIVVDDDPMIGRCLTMFLERHNYRVVFFTDGNKALDYLKSPHPPFAKGEKGGLESGVHFLLTDLQMPGMTGLELLRQVKALFPALPALVMSGSADGRDRDELFALGADFIAKPFELADVLKRIDLEITLGLRRGLIPTGESR